MLLHLPMVAVLFLVLGKQENAGPGELYGGGDGGWPRRSSGRKPAGRSSRWEDHEPSDVDRMAEIRTYPFAARFLKETLSFFLIEPAVPLAPFLNTYCCFENVFSWVGSDYAFQKLQNCH